MRCVLEAVRLSGEMMREWMNVGGGMVDGKSKKLR